MVVYVIVRVIAGFVAGGVQSTKVKGTGE